MQKTLPTIMHTSSGEKPMAISLPRGIFTLDRAAAIITKVTATLRRLELEWNSFSTRENRTPSTAPRVREPIISRMGFRMTDRRLKVPEIMVLATPKETAKTTRPTASSRATTGRSMLVRGPFALYWFTTIMVAAGAVAVATAPRTMQVDTGSFSPSTRCIRSRATSTNRVAARAWMMATTVACLPVCFREDRRNSLPMEKAMKPRATSQMRLNWDTSPKVGKPMPFMPRRPRQLGPIKTPATR